jgi:hypothetical protein
MPRDNRSFVIAYLGLMSGVFVLSLSAYMMLLIAVFDRQLADLSFRQWLTQAGSTGLIGGFIGGAVIGKSQSQLLEMVGVPLVDWTIPSAIGTALGFMIAAVMVYPVEIYGVSQSSPLWSRITIGVLLLFPGVLVGVMQTRHLPKLTTRSVWVGLTALTWPIFLVVEFWGTNLYLTMLERLLGDNSSLLWQVLASFVYLWPSVVGSLAILIALLTFSAWYRRLAA